MFTTITNLILFILLLNVNLLVLAQNLTDHLHGIYFYTPDVCTNAIHYSTSSPEELAYRLENGLDADGLQVQIHPIKNRTVIASRSFTEREFVCEYAGDVLTQRELDARIEAWPFDNFGYFLTVENILTGKTHIVDASAEPLTPRVCRLVSHSWKRSNVDVFPISYKNSTKLIYLATKEIKAGEELYFDYGYWSMDKDALELFPWLND